MAKGLADALEPLVRVLAHVQRPEVEAFEKVLLGARRVFVTGLGRTGLMARGFAMRLMHLGRRVYHVGDVITPAIRRGDLLVICSRTGRSPVLLYYVKIAQRVGARVAIVTAAWPVAGHTEASAANEQASTHAATVRPLRHPHATPRLQVQ